MHREYLHEHIIPHIEFHFPSVQVCITLLAALNNLETIPYDSDFLSGLFYKLGAHSDTLIFLCLTNW